MAKRQATAHGWHILWVFEDSNGEPHTGTSYSYARTEEEAVARLKARLEDEDDKLFNQPHFQIVRVIPGGLW